MFFLFISGMELSKVPGLSAAGANPEIVPLTSPADSDVVQFGFPKIIDIFPLDPDGHPTPAIITRAAVLEADIPVCVIRAGSYIQPSPPYIETGASFGQDPRIGKAVPDARAVFESSALLAKNLTRDMDAVMLAETIPGGTTSALMVLRCLGYGDAMVSSASPYNPIPLKEQVWSEVSARLGDRLGALADDPISVIEETGDPMQASVLGFLAGIAEGNAKKKVTLAGGTQMLAVAALFRRYCELKHCGSNIELDIATTCYVVTDKNSSFSALAEELDIPVSVARLDFSASPHKGLSDYEKGFVKEGVGAGGAVVYAERAGIPTERIVERTNELYSKFAVKLGH